jgi:hypothetical protein
LEKWAFVRVVQVEKEEEVEVKNAWTKVQHEGLKNYWCISA